MRSANHFRIMLDEITSFNSKLIDLFIRFVDSNHDIRMNILQYAKLTRISSQVIATSVLYGHY